MRYHTAVRLIAIGLMAVIAAVAPRQALGQVSSNVSGLYGTGSSSGGLIATGSSESGYTYLTIPTYTKGSPPTNYQGTATGFVTSNSGYPFNKGWAANSGTSEWISPNATYSQGQGDTLSYYLWSTTFTVTGTNASIAGSWLADQQGVDVLLNGNSINQADYPNGFTDTDWTQFLISGNIFDNGSNVLTFVMINDPPRLGDPAGLRVDIPTVPEPPSTWVIAVLFVLLAAVAIRRRIYGER